jgi:uncharacterized peroxidase-related enzyme
MATEEKPIAWVHVTSQAEAHGDLKEAYDAVKGDDGEVENLYLAMSQTPKAIKPADDHYLALLHNPDNPLTPWLSELVSTYVAILCNCEYAATNHGKNYCTYLDDPAQSDQILAALRAETWEHSIEDAAVHAALKYTRKLSLTPGQVNADDIADLRRAGYCDKGISYIIQLVSSFAYWARMINGLGTQLGGKIGL